MKPDERTKYLRALREEGYSDAKANRPNRSGSLPGPEERLEYCKGFEDWLVESSPAYKRWTPSEDLEHPSEQRPRKD